MHMDVDQHISRKLGESLTTVHEQDVRTSHA